MALIVTAGTKPLEEVLSRSNLLLGPSTENSKPTKKKLLVCRALRDAKLLIPPVIQAQRAAAEKSSWTATGGMNCMGLIH
jgi:hypothetical protein